MADDRSHDVVRVATAANPAQAHVWQQALEDEGISCNVVGDFLDPGWGISGPSPAEIWVNPDDLARAQEIIRAGEEHVETAEDEADET